MADDSDLLKSKRVKVDDEFQSLYDASSELELPDLLNMVQRLPSRLVERLKEERSTLLEEIRTSREQLQKERDEWEALAQKLSKVQLPEYVRLNVGGVVFATSRANLQKHEDSFFSALFSGRWNTNLKEDIFIDRSPALFGRVIDYLRGDETVVEDLNDTDRERLAVEADFYQLPGLIRLCYHFEVVKGDPILLNEKRAVRGTRGYSGSDFCTVKIRPKVRLPLTETFIEYSFKIDMDEGDIYIGLCDESEMKDLQRSSLPPGLKMSISDNISKLKCAVSIVKIRQYDTMKVQWTVHRRSNPDKEDILQESTLSLKNGPVYFVLHFRKSSGLVQLC